MGRYGFFKDFNQQNSPFLLFDYGVKKVFEPSKTSRGVGMHPHRGFETVTIALSGRVEHQDNKGNRGIIEEGGVQWMTAGCGIMHQEFFETEFNKSGGLFQMIQLWVNLPAKYKMTKPKYQAITKDQIPVIAIGNNQIQVIAGNYSGTKGVADTFSPINVLVIELADSLDLVVKTSESPDDSLTNMILVIEGEATLGNHNLKTHHLYILDSHPGIANLKTATGAKILFLSGQKIDEPIAHYGPFVMNHQEQLVEAVNDFNEGRF